MPQHTKTFRVFVSSTFSDMNVERRILQKSVFPRLEKLCESHGAKFQGVDLRWGVNEATSMDQKAIETCINEIHRCQKTSIPNFIILLGDRYGAQPAPAKIPADEMEFIEKNSSKTDKQLIQKWYKLDDNAIPPEYILQPRTEYKNYDDWVNEENNIRRILCDAVKLSEFSEKQHHKYFASATHQEIIHGILNPPDYVKNPEDNVFAFERITEGLPKDESAKDFINLTNGKPDDDKDELLSKLKRELKNKFKEDKNYLIYQAKWKNPGIELVTEDEFAEMVFNNLKKIIEEQLNDNEEQNSLQREIDLHEQFKNRLIEHYYGRHDILHQIDDYLSNANENETLALIGESGSGKSSILAQAIKEISNNNAVIIYRFIGVSSESTNLLSLLQGICKQIAASFNTTVESLVGEGREKDLYEIYGLSQLFNKCLNLSTESKPIAIFLDALDQLSDVENKGNYYWLPNVLPQNTKVLVSVLPEIKEHLSNCKAILLTKLSKIDAEQILNLWLNAIKRKLVPEQKSEVLEKLNISGLPIYLKLAFEQAKHWHSYDLVGEKGIKLKPDVKGIIVDFFEHIEIEHTKELVEHVVCYMLCGRYSGLTENEILEILVFDEEYWKFFIENTSRPEYREEVKKAGKMPIAVWSRLFYDLEPYLSEKDADGVPIITFFHRVFIEVLKERYGLDKEKVEN